MRSTRQIVSACRRSEDRLSTVQPNRTAAKAIALSSSMKGSSLGFAGDLHERFGEDLELQAVPHMHTATKPHGDAKRRAHDDLYKTRPGSVFLVRLR